MYFCRMRTDSPSEDLHRSYFPDASSEEVRHLDSSLRSILETAAQRVLPSTQRITVSPPGATLENDAASGELPVWRHRKVQGRRPP